jgi:hypothetical protein
MDFAVPLKVQFETTYIQGLVQNKITEETNTPKLPFGRIRPFKKSI